MADEAESPVETKMPTPERLIPNLTGETPAVVKAREEGSSPKELLQLHRQELFEAPSLEEVLREELKSEDKEPPHTVNLTLREIEGFQRTAREAQDFRRAIKGSRDPVDRAAASIQYSQKKRELDEYKKYGISFEKAYREYLSSKGEFIKFLSTQDQIIELENTLNEPSFKSISDDTTLDERAQSRIEIAMRSSSSFASSDHAQEISDSLEALKSVYPEGSSEYEKMRKILISQEKTGVPKTKKEVIVKLDELKDDLVDKWRDPMVRYIWKQREMDKLMRDFAANEDVIETQSVIRNLNTLHEWETRHQRTTIGGVLVGPPGVGKTTLVRHYLEAKDRHYEYIDLSEDVTRYLLYGSKAVELKTPTEHFEQLAETLQGMNPKDKEDFIRKNAEELSRTTKIAKEEAVAVILDQIVEQLQKGVDLKDTSLTTKMRDAHDSLVEVAKGAFHKELTSQFSHMVKKNGWRDGIIIAALRRGDSIIFDEFNKTKNWSLIYSLITAKPGENWYFADNDEWIPIPKDWRMYFTANIGRKHGVYTVAEALASRAGGKVDELDYPPIKEEMTVALVSLSNAEGDFLRSKEDLAKLYVLIYNVFPGIRKAIEDKSQSIPISYRTIRDLGEKLIQYRDSGSDRLVYNPTGKTFDEALYEVLVDPYKLYEDKSIPKEIVRLATAAGLMLDDSVKDRVIVHIGKEEYEERRKTAGEHKEDFDAIIKKIKGELQDTTNLPIPETTQF